MDPRSRIEFRSFPVSLAIPSPRHRRQLFLLHVFAHGADHEVKVAGHDRVELVDGQADAVVGDAVFLEVIGADLRATLAAADLRFRRSARSRWSFSCCRS